MTLQYHQQFLMSPGAYDPARADKVQAFIPGPDEHFVLPGDVSKATAIEAAVRFLRLTGATERVIAAYRWLADTTQRASWHDPALAPVNWRRKCDMARDLGISERQAYNLIRALEQRGVIARMTADNGYRGRRSGQGYRDPVQCGISLEPTLANFSAIQHVLVAREVQEDARGDLQMAIRRTRRRIKALMAAIRDPGTRAWAEARYEGVLDLHDSTTPLRMREIADLQVLHAEIRALETLVREALRPLPRDPACAGPGASACQEEEHPLQREAHAAVRDGDAHSVIDGPAPDDSVSPAPLAGPGSSRHDPVDKMSETESPPDESIEKQQQISTAPEMECRSHIQPQANKNESCNALPASKKPPADAGDPVSLASHPKGRDDCTENKYVDPKTLINPAILQKLNMDALRDLASEDAALYLDTMQDWQDAVPWILRELGVNVSAWLEAEDVMGTLSAFIAVLIIDRNRFHPVTPIHSPGGALRAFTDQARRGKLDLTRSLLGIWERDRRGKQPKAASRPERLS